MSDKDLGSLSPDEITLLSHPLISQWPDHWEIHWREKHGTREVSVYDCDPRDDAVFYFDRANPSFYEWLPHNQFVDRFEPIKSE